MNLASFKYAMQHYMKRQYDADPEKNEVWELVGNRWIGIFGNAPKEEVWSVQIEFGRDEIPVRGWVCRVAELTSPHGMPHAKENVV